MNIAKNDRITKIVSVVLAVVFGVLVVSFAVNAVTTISTNIDTDGTLTVDGASTLTGLTSMIQASSTRFSVHDTAYFGGSATTTINSAGNVSIAGTLSITGNATGTSATTTTAFFGTVLSANSLSIGGSASTTIGTDGTLTVPSGKTTTLTTSNSATSTLIVGCLQMYATSTATAIHLTFATAQMATTTSQGGAGDTDGTTSGDVIWRYGACPI